jgi:hypothetical protein
VAADYNTLKEFQELIALNSSEATDFTTYSIEGEEVVGIKWQSGGTATTDRNGAFIEDVLALVYARLKAFNAEFPSRENSLALTKIEEAVLWLAQRKAEREYRGVYGKEEK